MSSLNLRPETKKEKKDHPKKEEEKKKERPTRFAETISV